MRRYCECCENFNRDDPYHNNSEEHRFNFLLWEWVHYRKAIVKNRHGIEVDITPEKADKFSHTSDPRKGRISIQIKPNCMSDNKNTVTFVCTVKNGRSSSSVFLINANLLHPYQYFTLHEPKEYISTGKIVKLCPGGIHKFKIVFCSGNETIIGKYEMPVALNFQTDGDVSESFTIARSVVICIENETIPIETDISPFTNDKWPEELTAVPPTQNQKHSNKYEIPRKYYSCIKYGLTEYHGISMTEHEALRDLRMKIYPGTLTPVNYQNFWHIILWLDEMGQKLKLDRYNMKNANVRVLKNHMLELVVPGLAEKRPSVIVGDIIHIRINEDYKYFIGMIKRVNDKTVEVAYLDPYILNVIEDNPKIELVVRFILGRLPLERMHQGVDQIINHRKTSYLFPSKNYLQMPIQQYLHLSDSDLYNEEVASNFEQRTAVSKILNQSSGTAPYIVFGPPGTGKTITIVEAILQIKNQTINNRILVCAPANAACDMLTEKLMAHCSKNELIRIVAETVDRSSIQPHVMEYTNFDLDGNFRKITHYELQKYNIVVATLILIGRYAGKYKPNIVFIDEAAQASEPEVDSAIGMLEGTQIVLAGDHKQLGPTTSSKLSEEYGLGKSLLERLWNLDLYKSNDENFITMLKRNFRSHSTILSIPNKLFYENHLEPCSISEYDPISKVLVYDYIQGKNINGKLRRPGQAIEFCNIISKESRYGRSPSYFNEKEVEMVLQYVRALMSLKFNHKYAIQPEDIGIVTPYIRQVFKVKDLLRRNNFDNVEVGTTETFQGREKRIIIITTVRAQADLLLFDRKYNLGFVRNEKRFNVAITRAKSKLIIIGCAHVLCLDSKWLTFIEKCIELGVFCGAKFARRTAEIKQEILQRFKNVHFQDSQHKK